jgi:hypothetical protein
MGRQRHGWFHRRPVTSWGRRAPVAGALLLVWLLWLGLSWLITWSAR